MDDDEALFIDCESHQRQRAAVLCQHLADPAALALGFVENCSDPDDLQAWCSACEALFVLEGGMTPAFRELNGMQVVCVQCYEAARQANGP